MAVHAATHRDIGFLGEHGPLRDWSMTIRTGHRRLGVGAMAKPHVGRNLIHLSPFDLAVVLRKRRQLLDCRTFSLNGGVAFHALRRGYDGHHLARVGTGMTHLALQF